VWVTASHTSVLARSITVNAEAVFVDAEGRQVPYLRLVAADGAAASQEIPPDGSGCWAFQFQVDEPLDVRIATGRLTFSSPGLSPVHVTVDVLPRRPLLGSTVKTVFRVCAGLLCICTLPFLWRYLRARRYREGSQHEVGNDGQFADLCTVQFRKKSRQARLMLHRDCVVRLPGESEEKSRPAGMGVQFALEDLHDKGALRVEEATDVAEDAQADPVVVSAFDWKSDSDQGGPQLVVEVEADGRYGQEAARCRRRAIMYVFVALLLVVGAAVLYQPAGLLAAQWVFDLLTL
jgi:hypothetical protein